MRECANGWCGVSAEALEECPLFLQWLSSRKPPTSGGGGERGRSIMPLFPGSPLTCKKLPRDIENRDHMTTSERNGMVVALDRSSPAVLKWQSISQITFPSVSQPIWGSLLTKFCPMIKGYKILNRHRSFDSIQIIQYIVFSPYKWYNFSHSKYFISAAMISCIAGAKVIFTIMLWLMYFFLFLLFPPPSR